MVKKDKKRGGTTFNEVEGGPQHGTRASGEGVLGSSLSNFPEPEVQRQALGEINATADNGITSDSVLGQTEPRKRDNHPHGHPRVAEPSSAAVFGQAEALQSSGQSGAKLPHGNQATPFKIPSQEGTKCHSENKPNNEKTHKEQNKKRTKKQNNSRQ